MIRNYANRVSLLHLKALTKQPIRGTIKNDYATCPVGSGVIDWTAVLEAAKQANVVAGYVEQEPPFHPVYGDLAKSWHYLAKPMA